VGTFIFIATPKAAIWDGLAVPAMIWSMAQPAWPRANSCPAVKRPRTWGHDDAGPASSLGEPPGDAPAAEASLPMRDDRATRRWSHEDQPPPNGAHKHAGNDAKHGICAPGSVRQLQSVILADVTSAVGTSGTAITSRVHSLNRPNMVSVGTIVWLSSELMFFAGLFAMYFTARAQAGGKWPPPPTELNLYQAVPVTLVLIASSFTCQMGVFAAERGDVFGLRRWYVITFFMGLFFVLGQGYEYYHLASHGTTIPGSAYGSVFYLATGFHGLHVTGGLIAFIFLLARTGMSKFTPAQATASIVVSYYWHFVDIVWIALFTVIYFIR